LVLPFLVLPLWYLLTRVVPDIFQKSSKTVVCVVCVSSWKNFENRLIFREVMHKRILVFFMPHSVDAGGYHWRGRSSFGGEFGASHCNQWELCCVVCKSAWTDGAVVWNCKWGPGLLACPVIPVFFKFILHVFVSGAVHKLLTITCILTTWRKMLIQLSQSRSR